MFPPFFRAPVPSVADGEVRQVPYVPMRAFCALMGAATVPVVYAIMRESGYPILVAAFSASLVLFGGFFPSSSQNTPD